MAKRSMILQKQNDALFKENAQIKQSHRELQKEKQKVDEELETLQKRWHYCLIGIVILIALLAVKIFR